MDSTTANKHARHATQAQPPGESPWTRRLLAAALMFAAAYALFWGYTSQKHADPFKPKTEWWQWLIHEVPHPHHDKMPVKPLGSRRGFVPRTLPLDASAILPAGTTSDGTPFIANRIAAWAGSGTVVAVGADGAVLVHDAEQGWVAQDPPPQPKPLPDQKSQEPVATPTAIERAEPMLPLLGHKESIYALAASPDGSRIATGSEDATARLWDLATGAEIATLEGHTTSIYEVAFNFDGSMLATASGDSTVRIWDVATATEIARYDVGISAWSVAFSPDGRLLAIGTGFDSTHLWSIDEGVEVRRLSGQPGFIESVKFSPDGTVLATASDAGDARLWDVQSGAEIAVLSGHTGEVNSLAYSPDGALIATGSDDGTVRLWDAASGQQRNLLVHSNEVWGVDFSPNGQMLVSSGGDAPTVRLWNVESGQEIAAVEETTVAANMGRSAVVFSPDSSRLITAYDNDAHMLDVAQLLSLGTRAQRLAQVGMDAPDPVVRAAAVDADGQLWVVGRRGYVATFGGDGARAFATQVEDDLLAVHITEDGVICAVGTNGVIVTSADGGTTWIRETWRFETDGQRTALRAVYILESGQGWAAGDYGVVLHRPSPTAEWGTLVELGSDTDDDGRNDVRLTALHVQPNGLAWAGSDGSLAGDTGRIFQVGNAAGAGSWRELEHYLAPWWFLIGLLLAALALFANARAWRRVGPGTETVHGIGGQAVSDAPTGLDGVDVLNLKPIALGLSRFLRNVDTEPPITIAISGRWGTGKSSLMTMLAEDLRHSDCRPVWFNAWHHRKEDQLLAALLENVRTQALPPWWSWPGLVFRARLFWLRTKRDVRGLAFLAALVAVTVILVRLFLDAQQLRQAQEDITGQLEAAGLLSGTLLENTEFGLFGLSAATVVGLVLWLRKRLAALPSNPAKLLGRAIQKTRVRAFQDKLSFRHRFGKEFKEVCLALRHGRSPGMVILIDDLDRCLPDQVLDVLEAINYFVSVGPCIVVLGMDRHQVEHCIGVGFADIVEGLPDEDLHLPPGVVLDPDDPKSKAVRQRAYAERYLEKLVNIVVPVPALSEENALGLYTAPNGKNGHNGHAAQSDKERQRLEGEEERRRQERLLRQLGHGVRQAIAYSRFSVIAVVLALVAVGSLSAASSIQLFEPRAEAGQQDEGQPGNESGGSPDGTDNGATNMTAQREAGTDAERGSIGDDGTLEALDLLAVALPTSGFNFSIVPPVDPDDLTAPWRWLWWGPTVLILLIGAHWAVSTAARSRESRVADSQGFANTLEIINPLVFAMHSTPRAIKRFQNRMRYLAVRLNPPPPTFDPVDQRLRWLCDKLWRGEWKLKPQEAKVEAAALSEQKLLLLGAAEAFDPGLRHETAEHFKVWLEKRYADLTKPQARGAAKRRYGSVERYEKWAEVRDVFRSNASCKKHWPTLDDILRYRGFRQNEASS